MREPCGTCLRLTVDEACACACGLRPDADGNCPERKEAREEAGRREADAQGAEREEGNMDKNPEQDRDMTAEFYGDLTGMQMIGAFYVPARRVYEHIDMIGKTLCKVRKTNSVEVAIYHPDGSLADKITVYR